MDPETQLGQPPVVADTVVAAIGDAAREAVPAVAGKTLPDHDACADCLLGGGVLAMVWGPEGVVAQLGPQHRPGRPGVRAYVRRWRDVLDENQRRLAFMTTNLEHDPTLEEGLGHIRETYADLLPEELRPQNSQSLVESVN